MLLGLKFRFRVSANTKEDISIGWAIQLTNEQCRMIVSKAKRLITGKLGAEAAQKGDMGAFPPVVGGSCPPPKNSSSFGKF